MGGDGEEVVCVCVCVCVRACDACVVCVREVRSVVATWGGGRGQGGREACVRSLCSCDVCCVWWWWCVRGVYA